MTEVVHITYTLTKTDILLALHEEADYQRDGSSGATTDELSDLLGLAANEIQSLRDQLGRAELSFQQCDSDRRSFADNAAELRADLASLRQIYREETDEFNSGCAAYDNAIPFDAEPSTTKHDMWRVGWAWGQFNAQNPGRIP